MKVVWGSIVVIGVFIQGCTGYQMKIGGLWSQGVTQWRKLAAASSLGAAVIVGGGNVIPVLADGGTTKFVLPPINKEEKGRCEFKSSAMGQANAARDKLYDLRECDMRLER